MARAEQKQRPSTSKAAKSARRPAAKTSRPNAAAANTAMPDQPSPTQRYLISNLLSVHFSDQQKEDASQIFDSRIEKVVIAGGANVLFDSHAKAKTEGSAGRRVVICNTDLASIQKIAAQMPLDTVIEPELLRFPAVAFPLELLAGNISSATGAPPQATGGGSGLQVVLQDEKGSGVKGATAYLRLSAVDNPSSSNVIGGTTAADGKLSIAYDPNQWRPELLAVEPLGGLWTFVTRTPQSGQTYKLRALPNDGQLGWWQLISGAAEYDPSAGKGIKVGVIDTGVGPHPYLRHVHPVGSFLNGSFQTGTNQGEDAQMHGTHVTGIIAARPTEHSASYGGLAPAAEVFVARIFTAIGGGNQGDVANAIDALSSQHEVDIINMSFSGAPSSIERDAVISAFQRGTLCICAAGNQSGAQVGSPAAYPECVAVAALGLPNQAPADSMAAFNVPTQADKFSTTGIFVASFSNVGPQLLCSAPGNGIVSTAPERGQGRAPYVDMSGTSMSSPLVAAVLANLLAKDTTYQTMPRNAARASYAKNVLAQHAFSLGLNPQFQGHGLARMN